MLEVSTDIDLERVDELIDRTGADPEGLIGILQDIQAEWHYLPRPALRRVSKRLGVPENRIWAVATFYKAFTLQPRGKVHIVACTGTACHVRGAGEVVRALEEVLMIEAGDTTPDGEFSIETAHCLGACAMGPVVVVGEEYHGHMTRKAVTELLARIRDGEGGAG
jgi:NADH-quinone oxidoreductase subunit E